MRKPKITQETELLTLEGATGFAKGEIDWFDLPKATTDALYEYYCEHGMPYGVQKARTGDPDLWIGGRMEFLVAGA